MAIQFARIEYVKRSEGKNACCKAAYNKRDKIKDEKTGIVYSFESRGGNVHHEILLPSGANPKFLDASVLWNTVEMFEGRKNSQLAKEFVLALPDDEEVTFEDRIELARRFAKEFFVDKGVPVQIDIHAPHGQNDKNWHAHFLVGTRRFSKDGETFSEYKARDLDAQVRNGRVTEGELWGERWKNIQNAYFKEMGYNLRVDEIGAIAQEHLGPVRMRRHRNEVTQRSMLLKQANAEVSLDPSAVLTHLSSIHSVFDERILDSYLKKNVEVEKRGGVREGVLQHPKILRVYARDANDTRNLYTTYDVRAEEERTLRDVWRIYEKGVLRIGERASLRKEGLIEGFSEEQKKAFEYGIQNDQGLKIIEGRAGTGKSYLMQRLREAYEREGIPVIGLAPTHVVAKDLEAGGFKNSYTVHSFLFQYKNQRITVPSNTLFMVDEAVMLGTPALGEIFKIARDHGSQVILFGDSRQLSSIQRGGMFSYLKDTFGSYELKDIKRQQVNWQKEVSKSLSQGDVKEAVTLLNMHQGIYWAETKAEAFSKLVEDYSRREIFSQTKAVNSQSEMEILSKTRLILAHQNIDVDILNQAIHQVRQALGKVSTDELLVMTNRGQVAFGAGDRVQFAKTDKSLGLYAGTFGALLKASKDSFVVETDQGAQLSFNPQEYSWFRHGYASTIYKGQGRTVDTAYILHSPSMNKSLSYVALTRQVNNLKLYVSKDETKNMGQLIKQMEREDFRKCSLEFKTEKEMGKERNLQKDSFLTKLTSNIEGPLKNLVYEILDGLHQNREFYDLPLQEKPLFSEVVEQDAKEKWGQEKGYAKKKESSNIAFAKNQDVENVDQKQENSRQQTNTGASRKTQDVSDSHSLSSKTSKILPKDVSQKDSKAVTQEPPSLESLSKLYEKKVKVLFKDQIGERYKNHLSEIKVIALRVAQEKTINPQYQEKDLNALFGKAQYERHRFEELKEEKIKEQKEIHWTRHALESKLLSHIEGNLYLEKRLDKETLSKKDFKDVQKEGQKVLKESISHLKIHQDHYQAKGFDADQSKFMAQAQLLHEAAYNKKLEGQSLKYFVTFAEAGYMRGLEYQKEYVSKVSQKDLTKDLQQEIRDVSFYRVHQELQSLSSLSPTMTYIPRPLKEVQSQVQKDFRKEHYQIQETREASKETEMQKEKEGQKGRGDSRGFER